MIKEKIEKFIENYMKDVVVRKIIFGYIVQSFNEKGECIAQQFVDNANIEYENVEGEILDGVPELQDFPLNMVQPGE